MYKLLDSDYSRQIRALNLLQSRPAVSSFSDRNQHSKILLQNVPLDIYNFKTDNDQRMKFVPNFCESIEKSANVSFVIAVS